MHPIPVKDNLYVQIDKALIDEISTESGFKLYLAPEYNFEHNVTITGKVSQLPRNFNGNVSIGDDVAFSYHVISSRSFPNTADYFVPISEGSDHIKIWMNGKGEKVRILARQGVISLIWTGTFFDSKGRFQHGCQGSEKDVEKWLLQFKFGNAEGFDYKNKLQLGLDEYWKCNYTQIFAKKVGDEVVAIGDRIILDIIDIPIEKQIFEQKGIKITDDKVLVRFYDRGSVVSGGERLGLKKGDIVSFNKDYCEKYELWGKQYFLIKENRVEGIWLDK